MPRDYPDAFANQDVIKFLTTLECMELSNLKEMRRSLAATIDYLDGRESVIFQAVRVRQGGENNVQVD